MNGKPNGKPALHVLFTMNCERTASKAMREGPKNWQMSARSIEGFCSRVLNAGYPPTLFLSPDCALEHAPLLWDMEQRGAELAPYVHPKSLNERSYKHPLGHYGEDEQREIISNALVSFREALGMRPQSFRSGKFSASDATFGILHELNFRQGSVSSPGSDSRRFAAVWEGTEAGAHYVDPEDRLRAGELPFLELPVTTDPARQNRAGFSAELCIEYGTFDEHHVPIIESNLKRMEAEDAPFRFLCFFTHNQVAYHQDDDVNSVTLEALLDYLEELREQYGLVPATLASAHESFRTISDSR
jgi:hypothetical protein